MSDENIQSSFKCMSKYADQSEENNKHEIITEALNSLQIEEEKRNQQLLEFIDDFVNSQEYENYVKDKRNIIKRVKATQCYSDDILVEYEKNNIVENYPLTEEHKKIFAFKRHFEKYAENQRLELEAKKQDHSIQIIKAKISEAQKIFKHTYKYKQTQKEKADAFLLKKYSSKFGIDWKRLGESTQLKLLERFRKCHYVSIACKKRRQENVEKILNNLLFEQRVKKRIEAQQKRMDDYNARPREKILNDLKVEGVKIKMIDREESIKAIQIEPENILETVAETDITSTKKKKNNSTSQPVDKITKKEKKNSENIANKGKEKKEKKEKLANILYLPEFPIINPREKILPKNIDKILDLVEQFRNLDNVMEDSNMKLCHHNYTLGDKGLEANPEAVLFYNFDENRTYCKKIRICNVSSQTRKVRFLKFLFPDEYDEVVFEMENIGIRKLYSGCGVRFSVKFEPYDSFKAYHGKMLFLSYDIKLCEYFLLEIEIKCTPKYADLKIYPEDVQFGCIPIWKAGDYKHVKVVKLKNRGAKPCTVYIKKIPDPFDIDLIEDEENKENIAPLTPKNSRTVFHDILDILGECLQKIDDNFHFDECYFNLKEMEERRVKVFFKNATYIGYYFEKYFVEVYETSETGTLEIVGSQMISLNVEVTGHFLTTSPEILDFGICVTNSVYQISFEVSNDSCNSQAISVRVPSSLADMVRLDISTIYMPPKSKKMVFVKLSPRESLFTRDICPYFEKNTSILEFPIHLYVVSKTVQDYPPTKVIVYASLASFEDLTITCNYTNNISNFLNTILINMGDCSIYETVWIDLSLTNNSPVKQICGFIDLPEAVSLEPNFGFCELKPGQRKKFKLYISPEIKDYPSYPVESLKNSSYFFKLRVETIASMGQMQYDINKKKLTNSLQLMLKQLTLVDTHRDTDLYSSMMKFITQIKYASTTQSMVNKEILKSSAAFSLLGQENKNSSDSISPDRSLDTFLNYQNFVIVETNSRRVVWIRMNLKRPLLEFSHQTIQFPDTPCGSYSIMGIRLQALEREMNKHCSKQKNLRYRANFEIVGGSSEICVEPTCGVLEAGNSIKITLLAKPEVPKEIVEQTAKSIKYSQIYEMKLQEYQEHAKRVQNKKETKNVKEKVFKDKDITKKKDSAQKKDDNKKDQEDKPSIIINEKELECDYLDLYPAEMVYWRSMEPYYITANFTCLVKYEKSNRYDKLYLEAICKVTRPDFNTNLNVQRINFGNCLIGSKETKMIMLQNITYQDIKPTASLLNPLGCFSIPYIQNTIVPPEHYLKLPIDFQPKSAIKVTEYIEIRSNATVIPLILCGEGSPVIIDISPEFEVFRLETKRSKLAELQLKVGNLSATRAIVHFDKLFEIEALLTDVSKLNERKVKNDSNMDVNQKLKKKNGNINKKEKPSKFSDSLTESELESIQTCYTKIEGKETHFDLKSSENDIELQPNMHQVVNILAGEPELIKKKKIEGPKKGKKENTKTQDRETPNDQRSSSESKKIIEDKQYITQYNIHVGQTHIKSVVIICTIKS